MNLQWERQELSVGIYIYMVDDGKHRICYVRERTPGALEFVKAFCAAPEMLPDVLSRLASGKEIRTEAINSLLKKD